jgi:hypothetical protein
VPGCALTATVHTTVVGPNQEADMRMWRFGAAGTAAVALAIGAGALPANAATDHTERFVFVNTSVTSPSYPVVASGPLHALGQDTPIGNSNRDKLTFQAGTLTIGHSRTSGTDHFDSKTCSDQFTEQGTFRVLSGTGAYSHATGHGTYQLTGVVIGCDQTKPPSAASIIIRATGPLTY